MNTIKNTFSVSPVRFTVACMGMAAVWLCAPEIVHAAVTMAGYAAGAGMGVWGCVDMYKATKNQGQSTYAGGLTKVVIGALALGLGELLGSGSATLFGSDQTSGMDDLGL